MFKLLINEVQSKTDLTRKAIIYYEKRGLINPYKTANGYRNYGVTDLNNLIKISLLRKVGLSVSEIEAYFASDGNILASILRRKQHQSDIQAKRLSVLELFIKGENQQVIQEKTALIEAEESIYTKLEQAFPGYLGQMLFMAYQPFLNEPLEKDGEKAFNEFIEYLDNLPPLELDQDEQNYIEKVSFGLDMQTLKAVNQAKLDAINNFQQWFMEHEASIQQMEQFKNSKQYLQSPLFFNSE